MAKQIKRSDIVEKDIFKNLVDSASESIDKLEQMNEQFKTMAKTIKSSMSSAKFGTTKELNEFIKTTKTATQLSKEQAKVMQELEKANALRAKSESELNKAEKERLKTEEQAIKTARTKASDDEKQAKIDARKQKQIDDEANAYKRLEKATRELKNQSKELGAQMLELERDGKKNTKEFFELEKQFKNVTRQAQQGDEALKKLDKQVGDNFRNVGNYEGAINKLGKGLGALGLAFGVGDVIRSAGSTIIDFDQSIADLVSITGAGGKDLEYFKQQAIELGKGVEGGAKNVIEAYKLIGSAKPELLANAEGLNAVTESAIKLSKASGMDLPASATALTSALNQFRAPAQDAGKFINVLANGALFGSAEIPQITDALLKFGGVAKSSNVSIEESVAAIELLAPSFKSAEESGTGFRNVLLKLSASEILPQDAQKYFEKYNINVANLSDKSLTLSQRLGELKPLLKDDGALIKIFGEGNIIAAKSLIEQSDALVVLTENMNTQNTVNVQAEARTKTLNQALIELKGGWDEIVLSFSSGSGASAILTETLGFLGRNLGTILNVVVKLAIGYGTLLAVQKAQVLITKLQNTSFKDLLSSLKGAITGTRALGDAQEGASKGAKALGTAMKSIGFAIAIELAIELVKALYDIASGASQAREDMARLEKASESAMVSATKNIDKIQKKQQLADAQLNRDLKEKKISQDEYNKKVLQNSELSNKQLKQNVDLVKSRKQSTEQDLKELANIEKKVKNAKTAEERTKAWSDQFKKVKEIADRNKIEGDKSWVTFFTGEKDEASVKDVTAQLQANLKAQKVKITEYSKALFDNSEVVKDNKTEVKANSVEQDKNSKSKNNNKKETIQLETEFKTINKTLSEQSTLLNELDNIYKNRVIESKSDEIKAEYDKQIELAETTGVANVDNLEKLLQEETDLRKKQAQDNLLFKIDQLQKEYEALVEEKRKELELERDTLLAQKGITAEAKQKILDNFASQEKVLNQELAKSKEDTELKKKIETEKTSEEILQIEKDKNEKIIDYNDGVYEALKRGSQKTNDDAKADADKKVDQQKKMYEQMNQLAKMSAEYFIKQSQKKVEQIDGEINALSQQKQFLEQMAVNGNITAEKSLAQNEKMTVEANKKKANELKKQERIKLAETVFSSYLSNVEKKEGNPIVKTISDISVLNAFINSLPTFYKGTERTIAESLGSPNLNGKDGYIVRVDGSEKVLNPELSKMTGNMTTYEIAKLSEDKLRGRLMSKNGTVNIINSKNDELIQKIDQLNNTIINKPETNIELGEIVGGVMHVVESTKRNNTTTRNIRRFS